MFFSVASAALFYFSGGNVMNFAESFRNARKSAGMTQEQVAEKLNVDRSSIAKYEAGVSTPNIKNLQKICEILDVTIEKLLSE